MLENGYPYIKNGLIALDQLLNALLGGACDETLSSRTYRMARIRGGGWADFECLVNTLFYSDREGEIRHCELSYMVEMASGHMPKALRREMLRIQEAL
jgi:hypothetical protein